MSLGDSNSDIYFELNIRMDGNDMRLLFLSLLACSTNKEPDTGLGIELNDTDDATEDSDTNDTDTNDTDTNDTDDTSVQGDLDIRGEYKDFFGGSHIINNETWINDALQFNISQYNNDLKIVIAQNDAANEWNPSLWSKFQWTIDELNNIFYCQTAFEAATEDDAISTPPADVTDLESGCNNYPWSMLREPLPISGQYADNWGSSHDINPFRWIMSAGESVSVFRIFQMDIEDQSFLAQNDFNNEYHPEKFSKFEWNIVENSLYYCQSVFDAESPEDAAMATADRSDLDTGCAGFSWSMLTEITE